MGLSADSKERVLAERVFSGNCPGTILFQGLRTHTNLKRSFTKSEIDVTGSKWSTREAAGVAYFLLTPTPRLWPFGIIIFLQAGNLQPADWLGRDTSSYSEDGGGPLWLAGCCLAGWLVDPPQTEGGDHSHAGLPGRLGSWLSDAVPSRFLSNPSRKQ